MYLLCWQMGRGQGRRRSEELPRRTWLLRRQRNRAGTAGMEGIQSPRGGEAVV
jgi:hypothetical protein